MTWTYSGNPSDSDRDAVRFLIGDTDVASQQLQDEELDYLLTDEGSVSGAAIAAARGVLAKYARLVDKSVGDLRVSYSQRAGQYKDLIARLEARALLRTASVVAGGISRARKETVALDGDRVEPGAAKGQFDHPGTSQNDQSTLSDD